MHAFAHMLHTSPAHKHTCTRNRLYVYTRTHAPARCRLVAAATQLRNEPSLNPDQPRSQDSWWLPHRPLQMSDVDLSQESSGLVATSPQSPRAKGARRSMIQRATALFTGRGSAEEEQSSGERLNAGGARIVDASLAQISVARVRPEDEADLKVKNSGFFKLFHKADLNSNNKMNARYKAAVWSDVKPTFQSKLMVI